MAPRQQSLSLAESLERAVALHRRGQLDDAARAYRAILNARADHFQARHLLGVLRAQQGRPDEALALLAAALKSKPDDADALFNRGNILAGLTRYEEALADYDQALTARPGFLDALRNRGNCLLALGRNEEALACYDQALSVAAELPDVLANRALALSKLHRDEEAVASSERALALSPNDLDAIIAHANLLALHGRYEAAVETYDQALALSPAQPDRRFRRSNCLRDLGRLPEALAGYDRVLTLEPDHASAKLARCMAQLPALYADQSEIERARQSYARELHALIAEAERQPGRLADAIGESQPFYLPYQGHNDRDLQALYGALVCREMAARYPAAKLPPPLAAGEPIRVGFVSGFFSQHSVWKIPLKGWLANLDRKRFRVFGYHTSAIRDGETEQAALLCERFVQGPLPVEAWRNAITADAPHVLIYPEIGMDAAAAALAALRLAPVQCTSWGHPVTSGYPTVDYFLSSDLMEPASAESHYTETLVRLPNLSVSYDPPEVTPVALTRAEMGLREATVYWCAQSLYKYVPQFDEVFPRIAKAVGDCQFVFIEQPRLTAVNRMFSERLARAFDAAGLSASEHCVLLPRLARNKFVAAAGLCDVVLDSIGWSGSNSTLEGMTHDLPIVTHAGEFMRGRHTAAILAMMGVTETIAQTVDDYVAAAVRLGTDRLSREDLKARIAANKHKLCHDRACITALEDFLQRAARDPHHAPSAGDF